MTIHPSVRPCQRSCLRLGRTWKRQNVIFLNWTTTTHRQPLQKFLFINTAIPISIKDFEDLLTIPPDTKSTAQTDLHSDQHALHAFCGDCPERAYPQHLKTQFVKYSHQFLELLLLKQSQRLFVDVAELLRLKLAYRSKLLRLRRSNGAFL